MVIESQLIGRRQFMLGATSLAALSLAGCATTNSPKIESPPAVPPDVLSMYAALPDEKFPIPAARIDLVPPQYWRQQVDDPTGERPGTIVVHTPSRFLYLVGEGGKAMRYGVGVGRDGFSWAGKGTIAYKRKWPVWTPPPEMIERQPELEQYRHGMEPGLDNALGARALYIFQNGRDTLYRLHGTMEARTIGNAVSSGCIRLLSQDVIDLYNRVPDGSTIVVRQA
jgi:lipoprotein-anchoring transpeptidase ErfK/SrfK